MPERSPISMVSPVDRLNTAFMGIWKFMTILLQRFLFPRSQPVQHFQIRLPQAQDAMVSHHEVFYMVFRPGCLHAGAECHLFNADSEPGLSAM